MPNQSGKVVLVLIIVLLISSALYFLFPKFKQKDSLKLVPSPTTTSSQVDGVNKLSECSSTPENDEKESSEIWEYLPEDVKNETYREGIVSAGEATYEITLLDSTSDCRHKAFLIELVARGGGAYDEEDYKYRGVYIFDKDNKKVTAAISMPKNLLFDDQEYGSNKWIEDSQYQFVLSESVKQGRFVKTRYLYDLESNKLLESQEEL